MSLITLDQANRLIDATLAKGRDLGLKPLTVVVLDPGGHLIAMQRQDGAATLRPQIAQAKAGGALGLGVSSRTIGEMAGERPTFVASLGPLSPHGVVPAAGGLVVLDAEGRVAGAVGVTGDTSDHDEACAIAGIDAIAMIAQR